MAETTCPGTAPAACDSAAPVAPRLRDDLADLVPYDPDMRPVRVMLSANENNNGLPASLHEELVARLAQVPTNRYPEATSPEVRRLLAELWGVPERCVVLGNGGDELIFNLLLGFGGPGRTLVNCPPTFSAYELYAQLTATPVVNVVRRPDFSVDEDALVAAAAEAGEGIVMITSPNNPTGNLTSPEFVRRLAQATPALVVVDEAYGEFAAPEASCIPLVAELPNVCVLKTLSKAYALAGARVGYVVASPQVADGLLAVRLPYSVNRFSQAAAQLVLERRDEVLPVMQAIVAERERLQGLFAQLAADASERLGIVVETYPSEANFVLLRLPDGQPGVPSAHEVHERLAERSVLVRDFSRTPGLEGCLRISVGTPQESDELLADLRELLGL